MKNKVLFLAFMAILGATSLKAQLNVGSTSAADASAILQATSTTKGFLPPVMTTTQRNAIVTPAPGLLIFNSTTNQQEVNSGTTSTPVWGANTAATFYNADGTLATNRIVTQGANTLSFLGTGGILLKSGSVNFDSSALVGKGDSLSGSAIGIGVTAAGGLNIGQNTTGNNIFIGYKSGKLATGTGNQFIGYQSGQANTTGTNNLFSGYNSGLSNTTGNYNTFNGQQSGQANTMGSSNLFNGYVSGQANTTGSYNVFNGQGSGFSNLTGSSNTFSGYNSGLNNTTGANNVFTGFNSGRSNTTGSNNTFTGDSSGQANTTGISNVFTGYNSGLSNTTGNYNTFNGQQSGQANTTGSNNLFNGYVSGKANTTGSGNVFNGQGSGYANTTGGNNTFSGYNSGLNNTTGTSNVFTGYNSGQASTTSINNVFNGQESAYNTTTGSDNMFSGYRSGYANTTGGNNTFDGYQSGLFTTTGVSNTFVGSGGGYGNTTGNGNTSLGYTAGPNSGTLTNSTSIGYGAAATASNSIVLGNSSVTAIGGYAPYVQLSDARFKYNIKANVLGLAFIQKLSPVTYQVDTKKLDAFNKNGVLNTSFTEDNNATMHTGFLAQDVEKVADELGISFDGVHKPENDRDHYSLAYAQFVVPLVKAVQEQQVQIENLTKQNIAITTQNAAIIAHNKVLDAQNAAITAQLSEMKDLKIAMAAMQTEFTKIAAANKASTINIASN